MISKRHISTHKIVCWRLTRHCNRKCPFCLSDSGPEFDHPQYNHNTIASRLADIGVEKVSYTGGEPTLHPSLMETLRAVNEYRIRQIIATNGTALRENMQILRYLEYVKFSFYGLREIHDRMTTEGDYDNLLSLAKDLHDKGYSVGVNLMLSRLSLCNLKESLVDIHAAGARQVLLLTYIPTGRSNIDRVHQINLSNQVLDWIKSEVYSLTHEFDGGVKLHDYAKADFTIVLDELCRLWLAGCRRESDYLLGGLFDKSIRMPNGSRSTITSVIEHIWEKRLDSEAIVAL